MLRPSHKFRSNLDSISISVLRTAFVVLHWHWHGIAFCHAFVAGPSVCVPGLQFQSKLCRRTAFFAEIKRIYDFYLRTRDTSPPHPRNQYQVPGRTLYDCLVRLPAWYVLVRTLDLCYVPGIVRVQYLRPAQHSRQGVYSLVYHTRT